MLVQFSFPKPCLYFAHLWVNGCRKFVKSNPTETFVSSRMSKVIPLQLLHIHRSPFFGSLTISPVFQLLCITYSSSHIPSKISVNILTMISSPEKASHGLSVVPTYFPNNAKAAACDADSHKAIVNRSVNHVVPKLGIDFKHVTYYRQRYKRACIAQHASTEL